MAQNRVHARRRLTLPILAMGGDAGLAKMMERMMCEVADEVIGLVVPGCGHYIPEEAPEFVSERLTAFLG